MSAILEAQDVQVGFGGLVALRGVSLAIMPGEVVAVVGPNGAGKTTLLNAICGLVPMHGMLRFAGRDVHGHDALAMSRLGMARAFQHPQLIDHDSAVANTMLGAHVRSGYGPLAQVGAWPLVRHRERQLATQAAEILVHAGITDHELHCRVDELPYGARKRIDIARALMRQPDLLILDEPTSGMGHGEREAVLELLAWIRETHRLAIMVVEHHMDVVRAVADRVVALEAGAVLVDGPVEEVLASEEFRAASVGRPAATASAGGPR